MPRVAPGSHSLGRSGLVVHGAGAVVSDQRLPLPDAPWYLIDDAHLEPGHLDGLPEHALRFLVVPAETKVDLECAIARVANRLGRSVDGVILGLAGTPQERLWPTLADAVAGGTIRCAGIETGRAAAVERCAAWHPVDLLLIPSAGASKELLDTCRWSGVTVIERSNGVVAVR